MYIGIAFVYDAHLWGSHV